MKLIIKMVACILLTVVIMNISCKKELSCENCSGNKPPIAKAGPDQAITLPTDSISLDGSSSSDPDGKISSWLWTKISGPASFIINKPSLPNTVVKNFVAGFYKFELKVTDNDNLSAKDTVQIIVTDPSQLNRPPVADAGSDQTITLPTTTVNLNGSGSTDPDNNITGYAWTMISGPLSYNISNANAVQTQVTDLIQGVYKFELKVTDAGALFSKDTVQVTVYPEPPPQCPPINRPTVNAQLVPFDTLSKARRGMAFAASGNKVLFAGGYSQTGYSSRVDIYDVLTQSWSTAELSIPRSNLAAVVSGNKIFFAGGSIGTYTETPMVDIYDVPSNTWSTMMLSLARQDIGAAAVGDKVFFAGGVFHNNNDNVTDRVDIYNLSTNTWSIAALSVPRTFVSAITAENKIYFAGGADGDWDAVYGRGRIDIYDNGTGAWSVSDLNEAKFRFGTFYTNGKIYFAGGMTESDMVNSIDGTCKIEIYDINTQMTSIRHLYQPAEGINMVQKNNQIVFFSGTYWAPPGGGGIGHDFNKFNLCDITSDSWSIGVLPFNIEGAAIISVNDVIYVAGGYVNGVLSNQVWKLEF